MSDSSEPEPLTLSTNVENGRLPPQYDYHDIISNNNSSRSNEVLPTYHDALQQRPYSPGPSRVVMIAVGMYRLS